MKKLFFVLVLVNFFSCNEKKNKPFTVEGTIRNGIVHTIYLEENGMGRSRPVVVDSAKVDKNGKFVLKANATEEKLYSLRPDESENPLVLLINDSKKITVDADLKNSDMPFTIKGSVASQQIFDLEKNLYRQAVHIKDLITQINSIEEPSDSLTQHIYDSTRSLRMSEYENAIDAMKKYVSDLIAKTESPIVTMYAIDAYQYRAQQIGLKGFTTTEINDIFNKATGKFPDHAGLAEQKKALKSAKAPDFSVPDTSGNMVSLSSFRGKYVLIDFWASWCVPCRKENPNVVAAYNQFKDRNFTILGVSLDDDRNAWLKAIHDDGLIWNHVSDLQHWKSKPAALYGVDGIPYNFLLDPEGNIIAEGLHGQDLFNTLNKVLK